MTINGLVAKGETPYALNFNATYNDPQSPWLQDRARRLFGDAAIGEVARRRQADADRESLAQ